MKPGKRLWTLALMASLMAATASGFDLSPMEQDFAARPDQATRTFYVTNDASTNVAVQLRTVARSSRPDGSEVRTPSNDFVIYPQQVMLGPNEKRAVRVTYRGSKPTQRELSYRLVAEQLPVNVEAVESGSVRIKYLMTFVASIYVVPEGAQPRVAVESMSSVNSDQGPLLQINLVNNGGRHKILKGLTMTLRSGQTQVALGAETLKSLDTLNLLAGEKVSVGVPYPANLPQGPVTADLQFAE